MRVLVVDDHPIVRSGLRRLLAEEPDCELREAATGREALAVCREYAPDVVILDLSMPGLGGLEVITRLKIENTGVRILVLSMHQDAVYAARALQAGAAGFISKNARPDHLLEAVRRVGAGHRYIEHEIAQDLALANVGADRLPLQSLSPREFEILRLLSEGSNLRQIAEALGVSYKTAANTCSHIKAKLNVGQTSDLVRIAIQSRIVLP